MKIYTSVDLRYNELKNVGIQTSQPDNPKEGTIYYDKPNNVIKYYDSANQRWISIGGNGGAPGGGGEMNVLEYININDQNLTNSTSKVAKIKFSTDGLGNLTIKDGNLNRELQTLNIGSSGITAESIVAVGTLQSGYSTYIFKHTLETDDLLVQIIDNTGETVICDVSRYSSNNEHYIKVEFSKPIKESYKVVVMGHQRAANLQLINRGV